MKAWLIRPFPNGDDRISKFKDNEIIAIGWPELGTFENKDKNSIRETLEKCSLNYSSSQLGVAVATVNIFINRMSEGDLVVIPYEDEIFFAKVKSKYFFESSDISEGHPHQRKVEFLKGPISRNHLSDELRNSLRSPRTAADLSPRIKDIEDIVFGLEKEPTPTNLKEELMEVKYPLRADLNCNIEIPKDITKEEAERLGNFVRTLFFE